MGFPSADPEPCILTLVVQSGDLCSSHVSPAQDLISVLTRRGSASPLAP